MYKNAYFKMMGLDKQASMKKEAVSGKWILDKLLKATAKPAGRIKFNSKDHLHLLNLLRQKRFRKPEYILDGLVNILKAKGKGLTPDRALKEITWERFRPAADAGDKWRLLQRFARRVGDPGLIENKMYKVREAMTRYLKGFDAFGDSIEKRLASSKGEEWLPALIPAKTYQTFSGFPRPVNWVDDVYVGNIRNKPYINYKQWPFI